jgi:phosphatidylserine/phosphatidylglycerophosphate/cardiolipin synthase-like enzyme
MAAEPWRDHMASMPKVPSILVEGVNCWGRPHAERLAFLVDGAAYFAALKAALPLARHSVTILGWDFDSRVRLERPGTNADGIGALLRQMVQARPGLEVKLLIWDSALIYSFDR